MSQKEGLQKVEKTTYDGDGNVVQVEETFVARAESSVEFKVDSKGNINPTVKVYHEDPKEAIKQAKSLLNEALEHANQGSG